MDIAAIASLLRPFADVSPEVLAQTSQYIDLLQKWNAKINLTAVRQAEEIVTRHFGESFFVARMLLSPSGRQTVIDVGSGAGFPGVPAAMFAPEIKVTLIEANAKKSAFLNEVIHQLGLKNAKVFTGRAESHEGRAELVMMRAVEKFEKALPVALALVSPGGRIALMIGASQLAHTVSLPGEIKWQGPTLLPGASSRLLLVGIKPVEESSL